MLEDKYTILTRDVSGNASWRTELERDNTRVYELPCIRTVPAELSAEMQGLLTNISDFHWIVFTSATGVRYFNHLTTQLKLGKRALTKVKLAAVGRQTADQIKALGLVVSFVPSRSNGATLARELKSVKNRRLLIVRADIAPTETADILRGRSAVVTDFEAYCTVPIIEPDVTFSQLISVNEVARIVFASPSAVAGFYQRVSTRELEIAQNLPAIAIGQNVAMTLTASGFTDVRTAKTPNINAIKDLIR